MTGERIERRLAAILAADVAGYSRLTGVDEEGTHVQLKAHLSALVEPKITEHRGRVVKNTGDGLLAEFASVVDAVRCALDVQRGMAERNADVPREKRIEFRIGVNVGDSIIDDGDIFGDCVHIAVRLEGMAEPGGICVSGRVQEDAQGKLDVVFEDIGEQQLKNIMRPVRVYRMSLVHTAPNVRPIPGPPIKPSIAVLPFENLSGDPEQEYFADGIVEDIITALSRFRHLFVIARNSSFTYKGRPVDVKQVGRELRVRYVLEGSVRKAGKRVRIAGQLIDAATGTHLWGDRFEGTFDDIFDLQDQITTSVVGAIAPKLEQAEVERARRKPTGSLDAYDYYLRGIAYVHQWTKEANHEALQLFRRAIDLDPDFASAYGMAAYCYLQRDTNGWMTDRLQESGEAARLAKRAAELGGDDAFALCLAGDTLASLNGDLDGGAALLDRAVVLNPNLACAWVTSGWIRVYLGKPELAIEHLSRAMRLSPLDPWTFAMQVGTAFAHFLADHSVEALSWAEKALLERPNYLPGMVILAASSALAGRPIGAKKAMALLRACDPALRVSNLRQWLPFRRPEHLAMFAQGLRKAGLPER